MVTVESQAVYGDTVKNNSKEVPMADLSHSVCLNHPDSQATARCATCGKPVCQICVVQRNHTTYLQCAIASTFAHAHTEQRDIRRRRNHRRATIEQL